MYIPTGTYRIQLQKEFNFKQLRGIIGYLNDLGISTIYASPVTTAVKGSTHGYDNLNPLEVNPEIGTMQEWEDIRNIMDKNNMGWLQDIVPNHMAYTTENKLITDVYEKGKGSEYYSFFDIIPQGSDMDSEEKIMVPFLGKDVQSCIRDREISLVSNDSGFYIKYFEQLYPTSAESHQWIESQSPDETDSDENADGRISNAIIKINNSEDLLSRLLDLQHYKLSEFSLSQTKMNYRRFFAVNALICLRMEDENVYKKWHPLFLSLHKKSFIQGFRLDHIDGLFNPGVYLGRLRRDAGENAYIVSEKILRQDEETISSWPVQGTTGYDFLAFINQLFTDHEGKRKLLKYYQSSISSKPYDQVVFEKKYAFLKTEMNGELANLMRWLKACLTRQITDSDSVKLREALALLMCAFPVYRVYAENLPLTEQDKQYVEQAFNYVFKHYPEHENNFHLLQDIFSNTPTDSNRDKILLFIRRGSQYTAPLAAKGIEDTTFYNYNALISHNEVGDSPNNRAVTPEDFHRIMQDRFARARHSMNASSTHDTKRGEDNRLRINLISQFADEWISLTEKVKTDNASIIQIQNDIRIPSRNDEYMIYQALIGSIPFDLHITDTFLSRFKTYLSKAQREEKVETTWARPDEAYENGCYEFVHKILASETFRNHFFPFLQKIIDKAYEFILSQTLIKLTAPGIPDIYQGAELWDLSFVDPDNRLPVDFDQRRRLLSKLTDLEKESMVSVLKYAENNKSHGAQKLLLIRKILSFRRKNSGVFNEGEYIPVVAAENLIAYVRQTSSSEILIVAPLPSNNKQTLFPCKPAITGSWLDLITGKSIEITERIDTNVVLKEFPVALLMRKA